MMAFSATSKTEPTEAIDFNENAEQALCESIAAEKETFGRFFGIMLMTGVACSDATVGVLARAMDTIHFSVL